MNHFPLVSDRQEKTALAPVLTLTSIQIRKLHQHYGKTIAIRGIDLDVKQGELFGLIGPDGAGKTNIFNLGRWQEK